MTGEASPVELIDLSIPIEHGTKSFPGEPGGFALPFAELSVQGWVSHQLVLYTHLGTHVDAPSHFLADGDGIETWPLSQLCGPAMIARLRGDPGSREVGYDDFDWPRTPGPGDRVLLHTGWGERWGTEGYWGGFPSISLDLAGRLAAAGVVLLGMDTPTPHELEPRAVHEVLLSNRVAVLEALIHLERCTSPQGELLCLPLPLVGLDGAPCRAVFRAEVAR